MLLDPADRIPDRGRPPLGASARHPVVSRAMDFLELAGREGADGAGEEWSMDPEEIAILLFTSGTTGAPKAAVLRHKHIVSYILGSVEFMGAAEEDAALVCVPPYHIAGIAAIASSVYSGRRIVQLPNFTAEAWLETARKERITNAFVVPTMLARIVEAARGEASAQTSRSARHLLWRRQDAAARDRAGDEALPRDRLHERLRADGDELDDRDPRARRPPRRGCERRPGDPPAPHLGGPPASDPRGRDPRRRGQGPRTMGERGEIYVRGEQVSGEYLGKGSMLLSRRLLPHEGRRLPRRGGLSSSSKAAWTT